MLKKSGLRALGAQLKGVREWNSDTRRAGRALKGRVQSIVTPGNWPSMPFARAYWWDWRRNFGDQASPWLLRKAGINISPGTPLNSDVTAIGSILEHLPKDYGGLIWGSGLVEEGAPQFPRATFLAVRGHLTAACLGLEDIALGDPGLLVPDYYSGARPRANREFVVVRHFLHAADRSPESVTHLDPRPVDAGGSMQGVFRAIREAEFVLSSSLHGLVIADAFGVPAAWFREGTDSLVTPFKFRDYESVVSNGESRRVDISMGISEAELREVASRVSPMAVERSKQELRESLEELRTRLEWGSPLRKLFTVK